MTPDQLKSAIEQRGYTVQLLDGSKEYVHFRISSGNKHVGRSYSVLELESLKVPLGVFVDSMLHSFDGLTDDEKLRLTIYGSIADMWKVDAYFAHIDGPVVYLTNGDEMDGRKPEPKRDAYRQVADWLMSEGIQRILVYVNEKLYQTIEVSSANCG